MIETSELEIRCTRCNKLICTMEYNANPRGIHFWCTKCKKKFDVEYNIAKKRALVANSF